MKALLILALLATASFAAQVCTSISGQTGLWYTSNGVPYPCASTTKYTDTSKGACGCGTGDGVGTAYTWQYQILIASVNTPLFGDGSWCGTGCGKCYAVTPTGGYVDGQGTAPSSLKTYVVMTTSYCDATYTPTWCSSPNSYGYAAHFNMMDQNLNGLVTEIGWNNPEVYYFEIPCPDNRTDLWDTCECA